MTKPYSEYRDSGVAWLGEIPAHWEMKRAKTLFQKMDRPVNEYDAVVTCFRDGVVTLRENRRTTGFTNALKEIGYQGVRKGDLVIHQMDAFAGAVGVSDSDGKCTPVYSVCQPLRSANQYYYAYIVREMARTLWIAALAKGIRERSTDFRYSAFADQFVPLPPPDEQATIVKFLDAAERRIRRYIRAKQKLIKLLNEQKQAIIQQAVTRGLDPNVPMKDSGVEWLGTVPAHWGVSFLRRYAKLESGHTPSRKVPEYWINCTIPWVSLADVGALRNERNKHIYHTKEKISHLGLANSSARLLPANTVIVSRTASVGFSAILGEEMATTQDFACWICDNRLEPEYLLYCFRGMKQEFKRLMIGSTHKTIYMPDIARFTVPIPPLAEQRSIIQYIENHTQHLNDLIDKTERNIEITREYHVRLIGETVTGKVDVRGLAFELLEEFDEGELLEVDEDEILDEDELAEISEGED